MADTVTVAMESMSVVDLAARHRREKKDLQAKIQALKKNAPKSKRKEAMEEVARLENELEERHAAEVKTMNTTNAVANNEVVGDATSTKINCENPEQSSDQAASADELQQTPRISKAQKRRDKKAREIKEREEAQRANLEDARFNLRNMEAALFEKQLKNLQIALHEVPSDGDCLYNAVRHQVLQRGLGTYSVRQLREETANYILANKAALHCYMTDTNTGEMLTDEQFAQYCEAVRNTSAWGGEVELKALSTVLRVPIEVLQAKGPSTIHGANEFPGPNLIITYHRHLLSLGEHYNSTRPLEDSEDDLYEN